MALTATQTQKATLQLKTYDDLQATPDDGNRYELIFGEIVMAESPRTKHQLASSNLFEFMSQFAKRNRLGRVMFAPVDVKFSTYSVVEPDLIFISRGKRGILGDQYVDGAPDIVVEILAPSNRMQDLVKKAALYAEYRVPEYWIVDPESESVTVHHWQDGLYVAAQSADGIARSHSLTGFEVLIADIFAEPDWMTVEDPEAE